MHALYSSNHHNMTVRDPDKAMPPTIRNRKHLLRHHAFQKTEGEQKKKEVTELKIPFEKKTALKVKNLPRFHQYNFFS